MKYNDHIQFMQKLVKDVQESLGEEHSIGCTGDEASEVYVVVIGLQPIPTYLVMSMAIAMLAKTHMDALEKSFALVNMATTESKH